MEYEHKELINKTLEIIEENEHQKRLLQVLARLILKSLSIKTLESLKESLNNTSPYLLKVEDFNGDLNQWLDKGLTFSEIMSLIAREIGNYVQINGTPKSDL